MKKLIITTLCCLSLFACGQPTEITYHYNVPMAQVEQICGADYELLGCARWKTWDYNVNDPLKGHLEGHTKCDIYLSSRELLSDSCWNALVAHEQRHCREGNFHPNTPEGSAIPECADSYGGVK